MPRFRSYWIVLACGFSVCLAGRYTAPPPSKVFFPYKRIPTLEELINDVDYEHAQFNVSTEDGHILALHRISLKGAESTDRGVPVLMINGFAFQSEGWLALGKSSLPFILTELGYDVWLGDQRGTTRSLGHVSFTASDVRNHNYTFHEQGIYDLPAFIDNILQMTGRKKLLYIGYSLSSGMLIVMNSERPEYNEKLFGAALLAPAGHLRKWEKNGFEYLAGIRVIDSMIESQIQQGQWLFLGNINLVRQGFTMCVNPLLNGICQLFIFNMYGISDVQDRLSMFYQFAMTGTTASVFTTKHLLQVIKNGRFCKFDFGKEGNLQYYGTESAPNYLFNRTTVPIFLFYGGSDKMVTVDSALRSGRELSNLAKKKYIQKYNHADFLFASNAPREIYEDLVDFFDDLTGNTL